MQVTETRVDGLKREYQVVLPAAELDKRASERLSTIKGQVKLAGFRPGKVPLPHLKRLYGKSVMGEVIEQAISRSEQPDRERARPAPRAAAAHHARQ